MKANPEDLAIAKFKTGGAAVHGSAPVQSNCSHVVDESVCAVCSVRRIAPCGALNHQELDDLSGVSRHRSLKPGEYLFFEGDAVDAYFIVRDGAAKLYKLLEDGRRQIIGFAFKGDMIGHAYQREQNVTAEALVPTELCHLPRDRFELFIEDSGPLGHRLLELASSELSDAQDQMLLLGRKSAKERLASFLLWLSGRAIARGEDGHDLKLPMSRADMGDYLGLTVETVSRTVTKLKNAGLIAPRERGTIELLDRDGLEEISGH